MILLRYTGALQEGELPSDPLGMVRDVMAKQSKDDYLYKVTACIDSSRVNMVDKNGKSAMPSKGPCRVTYDYTAMVATCSMPWHNLRAGKQHPFMENLK